MCYNFATFVLYLDVITLIYRENRLTSSETSLSANDREVGWVANDIRLQPFCFSEATNLFGAFRDRP